MLDLCCAIRSAFQYRDYRPQPLTVGGVLRWLCQFNRRDRKHIRRLLKSVVYLSEKTVRDILIEQNEALMARLIAAGLHHHQIIYVSVHEAGSSSSLMLNMLRDQARLEQRGCVLLDAKDVKGITEATNDLGEGAIIYIDDFIGSGKQLGDERDFMIPFAVGTFSEFVLVPSICEEGRDALAGRGIEIFAGHVHLKAARPLHIDTADFDRAGKTRLRRICTEIDSHAPLGFRNMAVMVILYRNAPDNIPVLLRGSIGQTPYIGIFPRTTDMAV
jgi:hypothetical protein